MNAMGIVELVIGLAVVAAALAALNALVGKGPRGTVWLLAACVLTWSSALPDCLSNGGEFDLSKRVLFIITVMQVCGIIGLFVGIFDAWQKRSHGQQDPIAYSGVWNPFVWGAVLYTNYYGLLHQAAYRSEFLVRYTDSHFISKIEVGVFFVGLTAVLLRLCEVIAEFPSLREAMLSPIPTGGQPVDACERLMDELASKPAVQQSYIVRRLREALEYVRRKSSAEALDSYLRHLEELEAARSNAAYSMIRIIVWAIPILGLLGTVVGITMAVANLDPQTLETSVSKVTHGLNVAFDHTAVALLLTMALMFIKSGVERYEDRLLGRIDERVSQELVGRFQQTDVVESSDGFRLQRMSDQVVDAIETLAGKQAEIWKSTIDTTHEQWLEVSVAAARTMQSALTEAVEDGMSKHAQSLNDGALKIFDRLESSTTHHAEQLNRSSVQSAARLRDGMEKLAELLIEALERHGQVMSLNEREIAEQNRQHLSEVEVALGTSMASAAERQENLIRQSEHLLKEMQIALVEAAGATVRQQEQLVRQSDVLLKVVDSTGQIMALEESLERNLAAVQKAHNFEDMAINLSAAIQLLSSRLGNLPQSARLREVAGGDAAKHAA